MKIYPLLDAIGLTRRVSQQEGSGDPHQKKRDQREKSKKKDDSESFQSLLSQKIIEGEVETAIKEFSHDQQAQQHGIQARAEGEGPGLRVVLSDLQGQVLREVSTEEFLKLRDSWTGNGPGTGSPRRGKILDQKL